MTEQLPSLDFIAGLVVGEGSFMWIKQNKQIVPVFQLKMHYRERPLFELIVKKLGLKEKIHEYTHQKRHYVLIIVRRRSTIEKIIIPTFENRLYGIKAAQFYLWREKYFEEKFNFSYRQHY